MCAWQALKTRIACEPPWKTACSLVSTYFQRSLLEDFYRRQNDIIDSLMEVFAYPAVRCQSRNIDALRRLRRLEKTP